MKLINQLKALAGENLEKCLKCTICTAYCPVMAADPAYPGPKQAGPDQERFRIMDSAYFDEVLKMCLNCGRCETACPNGVRIADIIQRARIQYSTHTPGLRDFILANTDLMGSVATKMAPLVNGAVRTPVVKGLMDGVMKIDHRRTFPKYSGRTFEAWFRGEAAPLQESFAEKVRYFHGCYVNYNYPQLGKDFVSVMNALGYGVELLGGGPSARRREKCCGVALIANGQADHARRNALHNVALLSAGSGPVLTTSSTCTFTLRDEYPNLLGVDNSAVRDSVELAVRFISRQLENGRKRLVFKPDFHKKVAYHSACHAELLGWTVYSIHLLRQIPGLELTVLESQCCGIAGTYGFKKENYKRSQAIGESLFAQIRDTAPEAVVTECETCKWQIEMSAGVPVRNPVSLLAEALDLEASAKLNR